MIDLHNHILPALDDGARDLEEALTMAKMAVANGTAVMAATPHRFARGREITPPTIVAQVGALQSELDSRSIPLRLLPGSEIPMAADVAEGLRTGRLLRLGGSTGTHALIEPPFDRIPGYALGVLEEILSAGVGVILAHPERNEEVQKSLAFVESCAALGCVIQITSGSVVGAFGTQAEQTARAILAHDEWSIILASDAHWAHDRTPDRLHDAMAVATAWTGNPERAERMVSAGPASCLPESLKVA